MIKNFESGEEAREVRNKALSDSDWIVVKSLEAGVVVPTEWLKYRQALRDVTDQPAFPEIVLMPEAPE